MSLGYRLNIEEYEGIEDMFLNYVIGIIVSIISIWVESAGRSGDEFNFDPN